MNPPRPLLEIERLVTADARRPVSVEEHLHFQKCIATDDRSIDEDFDDLIVVDPHEVHAPSRRSDKDLGAFLGLLDSLETGNDRKEITR
jgi:hypothetical protein